MFDPCSSGALARRFTSKPDRGSVSRLLATSRRPRSRSEIATGVFSDSGRSSQSRSDRYEPGRAGLTELSASNPHSPSDSFDS